MKRLHLFEAVGLVDDRLIEEAADAKRTASPWGKWLAAAACVALALSLGTATAGTLLRGCGNKSADMTDMAAAPTDSPSEEAAPGEKEEYGLMGGDTAGPENAAGPEAPAAEPEAPTAEPAAPAPEPAAGPEPTEPAEAPAAPGDSLVVEGEMGGLRMGIFSLNTAAEGVTITALDAGEDSEDGVKASRARYRVESQSGADRTETLHFMLDTGEEGLEGRTLTIQIDGEAVPFEVYEETVCPAADGAIPEQEGRHFLVEFTAFIPAQGGITVEITDSGPASRRVEAEDSMVEINGLD